MTREVTGALGNVLMPPGVEALPRNHVGYPIPWFVATLGDGTRDFRVAGKEQLRDAIRFGLCWICGRRRGRHGSFVVGSMCAVNRVSSEPPSHHECATYAALVCPFLSHPNMRRRETGLPEDRLEPAGTMLLRNPGVSIVWTSRKWKPMPVPGGLLWDIGDPVSTEWYASGRPATYTEAMRSIDSGLPALREVAEKEGPKVVAELQRALATALTLLPDAGDFYEPDEDPTQIRAIITRPPDFVTAPPQSNERN